MNKIFDLTAEEKAMEAAVVRDGKSASAAEKERFQEIARNTTAKNKTITIRLSQRTLHRLRAAADREGVPYQTLVSSLIHKHIR